jgi:hypothetical protein
MDVRQWLEGVHGLAATDPALLQAVGIGVAGLLLGLYGIWRLTRRPRG